jgi:hypothetical protein
MDFPRFLLYPIQKSPEDKVTCVQNFFDEVAWYLFLFPYVAVSCQIFRKTGNLQQKG